MPKKSYLPKKALSKALSVLIVFMMLLAVLSTVTANNVFKRKTEDSTKLKSFTKSIKNTFQQVYEKFKVISENIKQKIRTNSDKNADSISSNSGIIQSNSIDFLLEFYTNYDGNEKTSNLRLFRETKIDIDSDSKDDIGVRLRIYPGIVRPLSLSINYKISIRQLSGFDDLDEDAYFKAMSQFSFPGLLIKSLKGDQIEFGYESPENERIPEKCDVTYKLVPHLFSLRKTPDHRFKIEPDAATKGSAKLNLIFGFTESDDGSEVFSKIAYDPVVDSEITFKRSRDSGVSLFEYERSVSSEITVDLYLAYIKDENETCAYALDLPGYVGFSLKLGRQGNAEFSTDEPIAEIGLCDSIEDPKNKVYFSDMFTVARLEWNRDPFFLLTKGSFNASVYTEGAGVSFNVHLEGISGGTADFGISPDASIINASLELDLSGGYFRLNRNKFDLFVSFSVSVLNESISSFLSTLDGSFNVARLSDGPFEIYFDDLFDGDVEIYLSGKSFELYDVDIAGFSELIGGNFSVLMDSFVKETNGFVSMIVDTEKEGNNITGTCFVQIDHGVEIENLDLKFNNITFARDSISTSLSITREYSFSICVSLVEWNVSSDLSNGTIVVRGNSSAMFSFNSTYTNGSEIVGRVYGTIQLKATSDLFNISWETIDGNLSLNIDGAVLVGLSDFYLWVKDKVEVSIPEISVNFELNTVGKDGKLMIYLDNNVVSGNINIEDINITDLFNITLKGSIYAELDLAASGTIDISWNESGITSINGGFEAGATGSIDITNLEFKFKTLVDVSITRLFIDGGLNVGFNSIDGNMSVSADVDLTDIVISNLVIYSSISTPLAVSADIDITFGGSGFINFTYSNGIIILDGAIYDDSDITINSFWFLVPGMGIEINLESFYISGSTTILFNADTSEDIPIMVTFFTDSEITAETIYLGSNGDLQIFVYDFIGGNLGSGRIGIGFNAVTSQPVLDFNHSSCFIGNLQFFVSGMLVPASISDLSFEGTARLEGFLDTEKFSYVYLNGEVTEDTTITLKNMNLPVIGSCNASIILEPGKLDLVLTQNIINNPPFGDVYVHGYVSGWITIKVDSPVLFDYIGTSELIKIMGTLELWVSIHESDSGTTSAIIDAKEVSAAVVVADKLRVAGELNAHVDFSINVNDSEETTTYSDLNVNVSGELSAVIQIKANETDWIPVIPFSTSGQVVLFRQATEPLKSPTIISDFDVTTSKDNTSLTFEVWYAPPLPFGEDSTSIGPFTYNVSFGDGTYYEVVTDDTRIVVGPHLYNVGEHEASVTVTTSDSSIVPVDDDLSFEIIKKITYLRIPDSGPLDFKYSDIESDGRIHTWFTVRNNAEENYDLEWGASFRAYDFDGIGMDPIFDPETGVLGPGETIRVNASFYPPADHKDHHETIFLSAENTNYTGYKGDSSNVRVSMVQSLSMFPSGVYLPDLNPGDEITSSVWIHNNKKEDLSWSITKQPNDNYSFSSTSGVLAAGGAEIIHFTVVTPDETGVDLGGKIEITDMDDPANVVTSHVHVKTKGPSNSSGNNVTITETVSGNVSIAIGGHNEIHLNNFQFEINGISGELNGHFIFDTSDSYVFINWTKNDLTSFSVDGNAEFSIENFAFSYGENISIVVSRVISGGLHCNEGKKGSFTLIVDDTFVDVDIDVHFNQSYSNFSLSGNIDIDIDAVTNSDLLITWDLDGETKDISVDGELLHTTDMDVSITDFILHVNNFELNAGLIHFNRTVLFSWNETSITMESSSTIQAEDIYLSFNTGEQSVTIDANVEIDGYLTFEFKPWNDGFMFCINTAGFTMNGLIHAEYGEYHGSANIFWKIVGWFCIGLETS